jgi:hypothetical protein
MKPVVYNVYLLMMLLAYVMRRAGTFSMEEKVRMLEFIGKMASSPESYQSLQTLRLGHNHELRSVQKSLPKPCSQCQT